MFNVHNTRVSITWPAMATASLYQFDRFWKSRTLTGNLENKKSNKNFKYNPRRYKWELVIRIQHTKVSFLSFRGNVPILSTFKRDTATVCRYCTQFYTVKAERAVQIKYTQTHKSPHTQALNITACCKSANHTRTHSTKRAEKHLKYTTKGISFNWSAFPE